MTNEKQEKPSLSAPDTVGAVLGHFIYEAARRVADLTAGNITEPEADAADQKTVAWLGNTFCGLNAQFEFDSEWLPEGLAGHLRFKLSDELAQACGGKIPEDSKAVIFSAFAPFMAQTYSTLYDLKRQGIEVLGETTAPEVLWLLKRRTELMLGSEVEFRDPTKDEEKPEA